MRAFLDGILRPSSSRGATNGCQPVGASRDAQPASTLFRRLYSAAAGIGAARGCEDCLANVIDDAGEQLFVLALRHDADHRLGPGGADDEPTRCAQPRLASGDRLLNSTCLQRTAVAETH